MTDSIFARSTGAPPAAIAVVRVSGPAALQTLERLAGTLPEPRELALRRVRSPVDGEVLDHCLVVWFPAGASVTGEPLVELHLHGGRATVDAVEAVLGREPGLRRAKAGEFTWRAFENGKLDLVQVEGLSDLLRAESDAQRRAALAGQGLGAEVERWRSGVLNLSAMVEAAIDQSDEDDVPPDRRNIDGLAATLDQEIGALLLRPGAERLFEGVRVAFAGPPNSGKSSLINVLAQRDVAIVSPVAGTTRDVIEAPVKIGGTSYVLTDMAGLRDATSDHIERAGIDRAKRRIEQADIVVWMDETAEPSVTAGEIIRIFPRCDASGREESPAGLLRVSAKTGEGLCGLVEELNDRARLMLPREGEIALTRRQRGYLGLCHESIRLFIREGDEVVAAEHLRSCRKALDELTGRAGTEEMLDALFGTFCVGK